MNVDCPTEEKKGWVLVGVKGPKLTELSAFQLQMPSAHISTASFSSLFSAGHYPLLCFLKAEALKAQRTHMQQMQTQLVTTTQGRI